MRGQNLEGKLRPFSFRETGGDDEEKDKREKTGMITDGENLGGSVDMNSLTDNDDPEKALLRKEAGKDEED